MNTTIKLGKDETKQVPTHPNAPYIVNWYVETLNGSKVYNRDRLEMKYFSTADSANEFCKTKYTPMFFERHFYPATVSVNE